MKNPIKSINEVARRTGTRILQKVHDKSEYILNTDKATRKANRKSARADKKASKAANKAAKAAKVAAEVSSGAQAQSSNGAKRSRTRRFMSWAGNARPLWFLNREQAKA